MSTFWLEMMGGMIRFYDAGGIRTRALEAGNGEAVIMLHGLSGHAETFIRNIVPLSKHFRAIAIDMIGHGLTDKPDNVVYHIPTFTNHLLAFMDAAGIEKAHFIGQSLGGWVSWWLATEHPDRVGKLISVTGAGFLIEDETAKAESREIHQRVRSVTLAAVVTPSRESVRKRLEWLMYNPQSVTDELIETRLFMLTTADARRVMSKVVAEQTSDEDRRYMLTPDRLKMIKSPAFILWSRHNPTTSWQVAEQVHKLLPGSRFHVMEDCAHWPMFEQPEEFNRLVTEFLLEK
jgi:2-hydroxy-6-oxonona-2,4-dienedioate hydrolase/2-hydroxy-6-oxo-6-(2'-carboxyphenyl)-hexa-2,4-dienoate hydrolase